MEVEVEVEGVPGVPTLLCAVLTDGDEVKDEENEEDASPPRDNWRFEVTKLDGSCGVEGVCFPSTTDDSPPIFSSASESEPANKLKACSRDVDDLVSAVSVISSRARFKAVLDALEPSAAAKRSSSGGRAVDGCLAAAAAPLREGNGG